MQKFTLNITYFKILDTINLLNEKHLYPLPYGVYKILLGEKDEETIKFKDFPTYGTLISYSSKKLARLIMMLHRYKYLAKKYDPKTDELYLEITPLGVSSLLEFKKKYHSAYKKKEVVLTPTIVEIK